MGQSLSSYYVKNPGRDAYPRLREIPFFGHFKGDDDLELVVRGGNWLRCPADVELMRENEGGRAFYVLISGKCSVMKGSRPIGIVHRGEMVGEMGALLGEKRSAGVLTMQESMLYEGHPRVLRNLPPRIIYPFMIYVFSITAKRLRAADRRLAVP